MIEPGGRRSASWSLHGCRLLCMALPKLAHCRMHSHWPTSWRLAAHLQLSCVRCRTNQARKLGRMAQAQRANARVRSNRFWRLVIASALNADLDSIALSYAAKVIRELFMNSAYAGSMGMSTVPLSDLYAGAADYLKNRGSNILFNTNVESAAWDEEASQWAIATRNGPLISEFLVLALPFEATSKLLPHMPVTEGVEALEAKLERQQNWPICSVHLWFDREITVLDHAVLLDREIHWLYNKSQLQPWRKTRGSYVELVVSASRQFAELSREEAIAQAVIELAEFFPAVLCKVGEGCTGKGDACNFRRAAGH